MLCYAIARVARGGSKGALSDGTGRTWTDTALVTAGSTGVGMHMEGAGGSGRGSRGGGKFRTIHIGCTSQESSRFVYCRSGEVNRSVVAATLLANKSGSRRTVLPFLLSLVDGGDCAAHGLEISVGLEIR